MMGDPSRQKEETAMMNDDLAMRSKDLHWPDGFAPDGADWFAHNEVVINAPRSTVWRHLVEAEKWPAIRSSKQPMQRSAFIQERNVFSCDVM